MPIISVIMPAFNAEEYIEEAIRSILDQTFQDYELIILNDGSTDKTLEIIRTFDDSRIVLIDSDYNQGLVAQLNFGINAAQGQLIARMDADDACHPTRLQVQHDYLQANPEVGLCATFTERFGNERGVIKTFSEDAALRFSLLFGTPIQHGSVMFRKRLIDQHNLTYEAEYFPSEDYGLWVKMSRFTKLHVLPNVLSYYRVSPGQITNLKFNDQMSIADGIARSHFNHDYFEITNENEMYYEVFRWKRSLRTQSVSGYLRFLAALDQCPDRQDNDNKWSFMVCRHFVQQAVKFKLWNSILLAFTIWPSLLVVRVVLDLIYDSGLSKERK